MPKSSNQKLKIIFIADYLLERSDEDHGIYVSDIQLALEQNGIQAEEHSISRDIALLRDVYGMDIFGGKGKPYHLLSSKFDYEDLQIMSSCISSAKFISKGRAEELVKKVGSLCSVYHRKGLENHAFHADRVRTTQTNTIHNIGTINLALGNAIGVNHKPQKISFKYITHRISNVDNTIDKYKGRTYIVSPLELVINDGFYYLFAFSFGKVRTYRIDRMRDIRLVDEEPEGYEIFKEYDIKTYVKKSFGMFGGKTSELQRVRIVFDNKALDAVLDRFGHEHGEAFYSEVDSGHFMLTTDVFISEMFYGWLCQFGNRAELKEPQSAVSGFKEYIGKIEKQYQQEG